MIERNIVLKKAQEDKLLKQEREYKQDQLKKLKLTLDQQTKASQLSKKQEKLESISFGLKLVSKDVTATQVF